MRDQSWVNGLKRRRLGLLRYLDIPRNSSKSKRRVTANHLDVVALDVSTYFRTQVVRRSICKHTIDEITILLFVGKSMMMSIQASVKATTYETAPTQGQAIKPKKHSRGDLHAANSRLQFIR